MRLLREVADRIIADVIREKYAENARLRTALREICDAKTYGECAEAVAKAREVLGDD